MLNLKIKPGRLINTIHETAIFGAKGTWGPEPTQTGVCRLALSDLDKQVRHWFLNEVTNLGCKVKIDTLGNMFAIYPGKKDGIPTAIGSHLDTQPTGGRYDGILGVLCGLEVLRTFKDNNYVPNYPVAVVNWTNEEGARFPRSVMSLSVWAELFGLEETYELKLITDDVPVTVKQELERIGFLGDVECNYNDNPLHCHFEIHIEQGPILEQEHKKIGIVVGAQAYQWYKVTVLGKATHSGTTPLNNRSDALFAASQIMVKGNELAVKYGAVFTVGVMNLLPQVANVIPDKVEFIIDARCEDEERLNEMILEVKVAVEKICAGASGGNVRAEFEAIQKSPAVVFDRKCVDCVEASAHDVVGPEQLRTIVSGAGHDSCATSARIPTAMIFIPSRDGVSHNPEEYSTPEQVEEGMKVMLGAVMRYDQGRSGT